MSNPSNNQAAWFSKKMVLTLISGTLIGFASKHYMATPDLKPASTEAQPIYWVAPMDANYRRDKPGLSPMGMDLVPVYKDAASGNAPGTITISPAVINNLGVRTTQVTLMPLVQDIKTVGIVQYDQDTLIHIHPRVAGWIENLYVKAVGNPVKKGQPLYDLYSPELVNAQQEFIAELAGNNQDLITAAEERLSALNISKHTIKELRRTKHIKQTVTFYAPQSGVIDNLNIRKGFYVKPDTTMMSIGSLDRVWVEIEIFERQASLVTPHQNVSMTLDFLPEKLWKGTVDYIYPSLDNKNRTLRARLRFDNKELLLRPNMFAQIIIHSNDKTNRLTIPREALIRTGKQDRVVLALGNGRFKSVAVKVGLITDDKVEIVKGLSADEKIVSSAQFLLDSESSKTSDFVRMSHPLTDNTDLPSATVIGVINTIDHKTRMANISRGPIEKWNREAAIVDFSVSTDLNIKDLNEGDNIEFTFVVLDGEFVVTEACVLEKDSRKQAESDHSDVDHSKMDHSTTGHN